MMRPRTIRYLWAEGWRGFTRHRGLTSTAVVTMAASLLVLGVFMVVTYNVRQMIGDLQGRKEVMVYLANDLDEEARIQVADRLTMHPAVDATEFVSREQAWEEFASEIEVEGLLDAAGGNPLPDAFRLVLDEDHRDARTIQGLAVEIGAWDEVDEVVTGGAWVARLDRFAHAVLLFTMAIGIAVALSIVAIVSSTVRLTVVARRDLVHVMRSVGASETFIRLPFLSEGLIQSFLASIVSLALLYGAVILVSDRISGVAFLSPLWIGGFVGFAILLGFAGSALSVRHVIRQAGL